MLELQEGNDLLSSEENKEDAVQVQSIRPNSLDTFTGQSNIKENLKIFISASKARAEPIDHMLFYGPPGLGKTTLAQIIAHEMGVNFKSTSGPVLTKAGDLAAILTNLKTNDILFIDEIHRLNISVEEILYSAMEDYAIDIILGEGAGARNIKINLAKFTLIGATTRVGLISNPLLGRFGIPMALDFYSTTELQEVIKRACTILKTEIDEEGSAEIAKRSRGTPRIALRILRRVRDFADYEGSPKITKTIATKSLDRLGVDKIGLDRSDLRYLTFIIDDCSGGPVGIETISSALSEERDSIEEVIESYLIRIGFITKTPRGRMATKKAFEHLERLWIEQQPNGS